MPDLLSVFEFAAKAARDTYRSVAREFRVAWVSGVEAAQRDALVEFEEENEFLEPQSADFDDEPLPTPSEGCVCGHTQYVHVVGGCNAAYHYQVDPCVCKGFRLYSKTPAASAVVEYLPGCVPPTQPGTDSQIPYRQSWMGWAEYVTPAIQDVLSQHHPARQFRPWTVVCERPDESVCGEFVDMQQWREHVAPLIAERLEAVTLAMPEAKESK